MQQQEAEMDNEQVKEVNRERIDANNKQKALDYLEEVKAQDELWRLAANEFVLAHSGGAAIRTDSLFVCKEANLNVLESAARNTLSLRPSREALETAWEYCKRQGNLCAQLEDSLTAAEKDVIVKRTIAGMLGVAPKYLGNVRTGDTREQTLDEALVGRYTAEDYKAVEAASGEAFRRAAILKMRTTPQYEGKQSLYPAQRPPKPTLDTKPVPDFIKALTYKEIMGANSETLTRWYKYPGAKEEVNNILRRHRRGEK
jgi:hypothetical protein